MPPCGTKLGGVVYFKHNSAAVNELIMGRRQRRSGQKRRIQAKESEQWMENRWLWQRKSILYH